MLFSTFCWHVEDDYLHSINYLHQGAPKTWYGIPSDKANKFEKAVNDCLYLLVQKRPDLLQQLVTQVSPRILMAHNVPVYTLTQYPGEFIITFPRGYHSGFNHGFNVAEAVNFATDNWFNYARLATTTYRKFGRDSVCSFEYLLLSCLLNDYQHHDHQILIPELEKSFAIDKQLRMIILHQDKHKAIKQQQRIIKHTSFFKIVETSLADIAVCCICKCFSYLSYLHCNICAKDYCLGHINQTCSCKNLSLKYRYTSLKE